MKTLKIDGDIKSQLSEFIDFTTNLALDKHPTFYHLHSQNLKKIITTY